jgi:SAM-dependent methyltransferase
MSDPLPSPPAEDAEARAVRDRYARRPGHDDRYSLLNPAALAAMQERQRAMVGLFLRHGLTNLATLRLLEVGSGGGGNLLELLRLGFLPQNLAGVELLQERHEAARSRLPEAVALTCADASTWPAAPASFDIVFQSTVFSSLLDDAFQQRLADAMWRWVRPGGGVLWYDFTLDNPRNPDVRGVPLRRVRALFPQGAVAARRITLAPPLARALAGLHPGLVAIANALPVLRSHVLAWIGKPVDA